MDRERAILLMRACEVIARIGMQQFKDMVELLNPGVRWDEAIGIENWLKAKFGELSPKAFHSMHSDKVPEECQIAWDAYQHIRREISWYDRGKDWRKDKREWGGKDSMMGVCFDEPMKASELKGDFTTEIEGGKQ